MDGPRVSRCFHGGPALAVHKQRHILVTEYPHHHVLVFGVLKGAKGVIHTGTGGGTGRQKDTGAAEVEYGIGPIGGLFRGPTLFKCRQWKGAKALRYLPLDNETRLVANFQKVRCVGKLTGS